MKNSNFHYYWWFLTLMFTPKIKAFIAFIVNRAASTATRNKWVSAITVFYVFPKANFRCACCIHLNTPL